MQWQRGGTIGGVALLDLVASLSSISILNLLASPVSIFDREGIIHFANPLFADIVGVSPEKLDRTHHPDLLYRTSIQKKQRFSKRKEFAHAVEIGDTIRNEYVVIRIDCRAFLPGFISVLRKDFEE